MVFGNTNVTLANSIGVSVVTVQNNLTVQGAGIHFHGVRQFNSNQNDGVTAITQCPIAPGDSITYTWIATQYGTSWYHSHYATQAWDGVFGPIQINGPASAPYDIDLGPLTLSDWTHKTTDEFHLLASQSGSTPMDNGLINGTNMFGNTQGQYQNITFTPNKLHRIRLISTAMDTFFHVSLDSHEMTVIAADFVPITPFKVGVGETLRIGMGQRYDVVINATADTTGAYWFHAYFGNCGFSENSIADRVRAIVRYSPIATLVPPAPVSDPSARQNRRCNDMELKRLEPVLKLPYGGRGSEENHTVSWAQSSAANGEVRWVINQTEFLTNWSDPSKLFPVGTKPLSTFR